mgnify:CR=1 FL=1
MSAVDNPFVLPVDDYKRDINYLRDYVSQMALMLHRTEDIPLERAREYVLSKIRKGGEHEFKDRVLRHTYRESNGDRFERTSGLHQYIKTAIAENNIISPTLTRYLHPSVKISPLSLSIDKKVAARSKNKAIAKEAAMAGDHDLAINKENHQKANKTSNNATSGALVSSSTVLVNPSGHATLTSTCRLTSGFGNANNEKIVMGNRHYRLPSIAINNILSTADNTDFPRLQATMDKYNLHYPSVEETIKVVEKGSYRYWTGEKPYQFINELVSKLTPLERAAFVYTGDLYHIRQYNDEVVRQFLTELCTRIEVPLPLEIAKLQQKRFNDDYISLANQLQGEEMKGISIKKASEAHPELYGKVVATLVNIERVLEKYADFIRTFFTTTNIPASIAYLPTMIRDCAVVSDTDSTIFTVQDWAGWYAGETKVNAETLRIGAGVSFFASQTITHILAVMSANFGVAKERMFQIGMKNEFRFDVLGTTEETKHYWSVIGCREGNVYEEYELERKGVHLRNSSVSVSVMKAAEKMMTKICHDLIDGKKISMQYWLQHVADHEIEIMNDVKEGKSNYFKRIKVNPAESYKQGDKSVAYLSYTLWRDVFAPKYGDSETPPFVSYKINTTLRNKTKFKAWLASFKDEALRKRMEDWMERNGKAMIKTFYLPATVVYTSGIPAEIFELIDLRRIVVDNVSVFYKVLETLGFFTSDKHLNRLICDMPDFSQHSTNPDWRAIENLAASDDELGGGSMDDGGSDDDD